MRISVYQCVSVHIRWFPEVRISAYQCLYVGGAAGAHSCAPTPPKREVLRSIKTLLTRRETLGSFLHALSPRRGLLRRSTSFD